MSVGAHTFVLASVASLVGVECNCLRPDRNGTGWARLCFGAWRAHQMGRAACVLPGPGTYGCGRLVEIPGIVWLAWLGTLTELGWGKKLGSLRRGLLRGWGGQSWLRSGDLDGLARFGSLGAPPVMTWGGSQLWDAVGASGSPLDICGRCGGALGGVGMVARGGPRRSGMR